MKWNIKGGLFVLWVCWLALASAAFAASRNYVVQGDIVYTPACGEAKILPQGYLVVKEGKVQGAYDKLPKDYEGWKKQDCRGKLILPGFCDLHVHAAQYRQIGLGMDEALLEWLEKYTFPEERKFSDTAYAERVYGDFAAELAKCGTTRSAVYGTIHRQGAEILARKLTERGLGAYVGKVNMDRNAPDYLCETSAGSLAETERFVKAPVWTDLVRPILTPRFAPSVTPELLQDLGALAKRENLPVQTHLSENKAEIQWVAELFPKIREYPKVYEHFGLYGDTPTLMAHCIHMSEAQIKEMVSRGVYPVFCPESNLNLTSGIMPVRKFLQAGAKVALGSDVGAGHDLFMPYVIVRAIQVSKVRAMDYPEEKALTLPEAFYLATKGGGSFFGKVGSFEPDYDADFLVVKTPKALAERSVQERWQHFIYHGTPEDITARYVAGKQLRLP